MADLRELIEGAAAKPTSDTPLSSIEARLRRRRSWRRTVAGLGVVAVVAGIGGSVVLTTDDGPSVRTAAAAGQTVAASTEPPVTVTLPDGWVESPIEAPFRFDQEILTVGTALQPMGAPHHVCVEAPEFHDDVFVQLQEFTHVIVLNESIGGAPAAYGVSDEFLPRPGDFSVAAPNQELSCVTNDPTMNWHGMGFSFADQGRLFNAEVGFGPTSNPERRAEAFAVLNSLVVEPLISEIPLPTTVPPSTVPESAETAAITAAFLGWIDTRPIDASGVYIEDFASIREAVIGAAAANGHPDDYRGRVEAITRVSENDADVIYSFIIDGQPVVANLPGRAVKIDGVWLVSRDTVCDALTYGPVHCPPGE